MLPSQTEETERQRNSPAHLSRKLHIVKGCREACEARSGARTKRQPRLIAPLPLWLPNIARPDKPGGGEEGEASSFSGYQTALRPDKPGGGDLSVINL